MGRLGYGELEAGAETAAAQAFHPQGALALPGLSFSGDSNTGWYLQGEDSIGEVVGGVEQFRSSSGVFAFQLSTAISSTGTLTITAPTITTPTIASTGWALATHAHAANNSGGTVAITATTGTLLIANGGTSSTSASAARTALGLAIGSNVQAYDADLAAIAGLTSASDKLPYFTGSGTASVTTFTSAGRALVDDADTAAQRTTLGLVIGTNVQAYDADLAAIAGLGKSDSNFIVGNGSAWVAEGASTARTSLGLGSLATASTVNNGNWSGTDLEVLNGGTGASSLTDLITLGTHTTGNYVKTLANATNGGTTIANGSAEGGDATVAMNFSNLTAAAVNVAADSIPFLDADGTATRIESIADLVTAMAGTNLTAASGQLSASGGGVPNAFFFA